MIRLVKADLPPQHHLYCVDTPSGDCYLTARLDYALRYIGKHLGKPLTELTSAAAVAAGYSIRRA